VSGEGGATADGELRVRTPKEAKVEQNKEEKISNKRKRTRCPAPQEPERKLALHFETKKETERKGG